MTAHDPATGTSWAVHRPPLQLGCYALSVTCWLIMISPTRLFCRVRSGHLNVAWLQPAFGQARSVSPAGRNTKMNAGYRTGRLVELGGHDQDEGFVAECGLTHNDLLPSRNI